MTLTVWIRLVAMVAVLAAALAIYFAWHAEQRDRARLMTELASAKQALEASDARQKERDAKLTDTLAAITAQKRAQQSPAEIVKNLLSQMQLPAAITLQRAPETQRRTRDSGHRLGRPYDYCGFHATESF